MQSHHSGRDHVDPHTKVHEGEGPGPVAAAVGEEGEGRRGRGGGGSEEGSGGPRGGGCMWQSVCVCDL